MTRGVLILTPYFHPVIGGVESNAGRLAQYLAGEGIRVHVLTKRIGRDLRDVETLGGVTIQRVGPRGERSASGKWQVIPAAVGWLVRHASLYDVVCCVDYRATALAALCARTVTGRPVVVQAQTTGVLSGDNADPLLKTIGLSTAGPIARLTKRAIRAVYSRADAISGISHEIEREAIASGVGADRVYHFPNAIDMTRFRPVTPGERENIRQSFDLAADRVLYVFVGRLSKEKGLLDLLEAWRTLRVRLKPDTTALPLLAIAGPDMTGHAWDSGASGRQFVSEHGLQDTVRFLGPLDDVAPLVKAADVVVQPSHFEALGLSAIEALACGVPVIASAVGGLLEFVVDGSNGLLCPPHNPEALASCLGRLLSDPGARGQLAARARASVVDEYDERAVFARMRDLFERLSQKASA